GVVEGAAVGAQRRVAQRIFFYVVVGKVRLGPAVAVLPVDLQFQVVPAVLLAVLPVLFGILPRVGARHVQRLARRIGHYRANVEVRTVEATVQQRRIAQRTVG